MLDHSSFETSTVLILTHTVSQCTETCKKLVLYEFVGLKFVVISASCSVGKEGKRVGKVVVFLSTVL